MYETPFSMAGKRKTDDYYKPFSFSDLIGQDAPNPVLTNNMPDISPYTRVIAECLDSLEDEPPDELNGDRHTHRLVNMLQGRMLEHLKSRVSSYYGLAPEALSEDFSIALIEVFSEIFGVFRERVEEQPWLIFHIARRIVEVETNATGDPEKRINKLYLSIFCKYFEYRNLETIITKLQSDSRVQRSILAALPKQKQAVHRSS